MPAQLQPFDFVRLPLVGSTFTRTAAGSSTASTSSGVVGIGAVGIMIVGITSSVSKDQHFINMIPYKVVNKATKEELFYVMKRPGFASLNTPATGTIGTAVHTWSGVSGGVISAFGGTNSTIYNGTSSLGALTGVCEHIDETLVGTTANLTFTTDGNTAYFYPNGGVMTSISDVDFPGNVAGQTITGGFRFLDGFSFIMTTTGRIYNSDEGSLSAWTANSYVSCTMSPDNGIGLARYKNYIVAFSKESIEFWYNAGNPTASPLQRAENGYINIGCVNNKAYGEIDDTVAWIGTDSNSRIGIYVLEGLQARRISNSEIEAVLSTSNPSSMYLNMVVLLGKTFVIIVSGSNATTYVYSIEDDLWHEWSSAIAYWQRCTGISTGTKYIYSVSRDNTNGKVYVIDPTSFVFQDNGTNFTCTIQTIDQDFGNQRMKFYKKVRILADVDDSANSWDVQWSDDDYQTWSTARAIDLSDSYPVLPHCGSSRSRSFRLTSTANRPARFQALEFELKQGIR